MNQRVKELIETIKKADHAYYIENREIMTNKEYDALYDELVGLEKKLGVISPDSPTQMVGYGNDNNLFDKVEHKNPMLSLEKSKQINDIEDFLGGREGVLTQKYDGLTLVLTYSNGRLQRMVTRGNGRIGEDVTANFRLFTDIPAKIPNKISCQVRGEAMLSYKQFEQLNKLYDGLYKNPRNLASGMLRSKEIKKEHVMTFVAYELLPDDGRLETYKRELEVLTKQGFNTAPSTLVTTETIEDELNVDITTSPYPLDGLVIRFNDNKLIEELGSTSKTPRYAMAFKWADESVGTVLKGVDWSVSRMGTITPVAVFEPVELCGTTVNRASLHNLSIMRSLELGIGDTITTYKANMIIPQVEDNLTRSNTLEPPTECPVCGGAVLEQAGKEEGVLQLMCLNENCIAKRTFQIELFCSNEGLDIRGFSEKTIEAFLDAGIIHSLPDIFKVEEHKDIICSMPKMGEKSYKNLIESIERAKETTAAKFLRSLGITLVGNSVSNKIFPDGGSREELIALTTMSANDLASNYGIGTVASKNLANYFKNENNRAEFDELMRILNFKEKVEINKSNDLQDKVFAITGKLLQVSRKDLTNLLKNAGAKVQSEVNSKTTHLVNNDVNSTSSKNKTAKSLNVPIITENEVLSMLG